MQTQKAEEFWGDSILLRNAGLPGLSGILFFETGA